MDESEEVVLNSCDRDRLCDDPYKLVLILDPVEWEGAGRERERREGRKWGGCYSRCGGRPSPSERAASVPTIDVTYRMAQSRWRGLTGRDGGTRVLVVR